MAKSPCAVFWDIQNVNLSKTLSASIVTLIRSSIISPYNLREVYFYCVCDVRRLPVNIGDPLTNLDVHLVQAYLTKKDSADVRIVDLMRKFVESQGPGCSVILLSGDGDYTATLVDLKKLYNITIYLIRKEHSFSAKLEAASDFTFILTDNHLKLIKSCGQPKFFVAFSRFAITRGIRKIKIEIDKMVRDFGSIERSAIAHENEIIIGFPSLELAQRAVNRFNTARHQGSFLKVEIMMNPTLEILNKVRNSCASINNRRPGVRFSPRRSTLAKRVTIELVPRNGSINRGIKRTLSDDYIPITSSNRTVITDCTVSSGSRPLQPSSPNQRNLRSTKQPKSTQWSQIYSRATNIKSPKLIDLCGDPDTPLRDPRLFANKPSSSLSSEPVVVDLTID